MTHSKQVWLRCITATVGGYAISTGFSIALVPALTVWLNYTLSTSVLITTMLSYLCYFIVIILSFCLPTLLSLWRNLFIFCTLLLACYQIAIHNNLHVNSKTESVLSMMSKQTISHSITTINSHTLNLTYSNNS
jgi:hypothetical protein